MMNQLFNTVLQQLKNEEFEIFKETTIDQSLINFKDKDQRTLLFYAIIENKNVFFDYLLEKKAFINIVDRHGYSPLHYAINEYRVDMVRRLIDKGANIEMFDSYGNNVLARAVLTSKGRKEIIKFLLEKGANPNIPNYKGYTAIDMAKVIGNIDIIEIFK